MIQMNDNYQNWFKKLTALRPGEDKKRLRIFSWLLVGIFQSKSIHLTKIANQIPDNAKKLSNARRLSRLLSNAKIHVRVWYKPIAIDTLKAIGQNVKEIRLVVDGTKIGFGCQLLMVAVAYRRRTIPIAWTWVRIKRGHSSSRKQLALLAYVKTLLPAQVPVSLVGDSEFGSVAIQKTLDLWKWKYVLRQKSSHLVQLHKRKTWRTFGDFIVKPGQRLWLGKALLTKEHAYQVNLAAYWKRGEDEPWLLATNAHRTDTTWAMYKRRMWIEEMFGDLKKHGFDLESTHLRHFQRLSRLTLAAALLYLWLVAFGSKVIKAGRRHLVDRVDRRDLSIFRIGYDMIERYQTNLFNTLITFDLRF